jgi:prevent-host-death family protein
MSTNTITTSDLRENMAEALDAVTGDMVLVVTRRGKPEKAIIDLDKLEDLLAASDPAYLESIREARESKELFSHEDVFGDI